ncbi:DUF2510 domain-containing protein [Microbacterium sp. A8/3-1]|uniref:DUF2510 domain-containing protein n=1 Tax=Microbacterium sp. A8/3-1 TaxID=3160749 RepID=A0AAU7VWZ3_9MICO
MTTPAGWYDDGSGRQRWWDGQQWTEHFAPEAPAAPEAAAPEVPAEPEAPAIEETPAADTTVAEQVPSAESAAAVDTPAAAAETPATPDHTAVTSAPEAVEEAVVAPEPPQAWSPAPADDASQTAAFAAPGATAPTTPLGGAPYPGSTAAVPPVPPIPQSGAPAYPGSAAPAYPAAPGAYPASGGAYPSAGAYAAGGYPASAPYAAPAPTGPKKMSVLGLVGLGLAALGLILAFIPFTLGVAWILLGAGFIVSIISLFLKGKKWPGITGLGVAILGAIIAAIVTVVVVGLAFANQIEDAIPDPISTSDTGTDEGTDESAPPADVAEGSMGEPVTVQQMSGTGEVTVNSATWSPTNDSGFDPSNGGYLLVDLTWKTLDGTTYVNPLYFSIETAEGAPGDYDIFGDATLESSELPAGQTTQGTVSFDVAQSGSYVIIITDELLQEVARVTVEPSAG